MLSSTECSAQLSIYSILLIVWHFNIYQRDKYIIWLFQSMEFRYFFNILMFISSGNLMIIWDEYENAL